MIESLGLEPTVGAGVADELGPRHDTSVSTPLWTLETQTQVPLN